VTASPVPGPPVTVPRTRAVVLLCLLLLLPACGLPLPGGVQSAGHVRAEQEEPEPIRVIPPGPQPGATPEEIVRGFLRAQSSPEDAHAVAREFLAPDATWDDERGAVVYRSRRFAPDSDRDPLTFAVRFETTARISSGGAFTLASEPVSASYTVAQMPSGEYRLTSVPAGLHLRAQDRSRSYRPYEVYFLPREQDGRAGTQLVPDRVFLPVTAERGPALVGALLRGASLRLRSAVDSAVPAGTTTASPVRVSDGVVTVDLTEQVRRLDSSGRQRLSAQLVWTLLPTFSGVRLLVEGEPLEVDGAGAVQTRDDWTEYEPAGVAPGAALYYVQERRVRSLDGSLPDSAATPSGPLPVDAVAVSPRGSAVGLLTRDADGPDEVRTGPLQGPFGAPVLTAPELGSLSWGRGDHGLWVLERGPVPVVWRLPGPGASVTEPSRVAYERPADAGPLSALRVSRDGARVALVFGEGQARRLYVGRVEPTASGLRIAGVDPIAPSLSDVTDVTWESGTSLAVLASTAGSSQVVVWTVAVDGSVGPSAVQRPGLPGDALALAAAPGRPLVVSALLDGQTRLFRDNGTLFRLQEPRGSAPAYPG
jgi:hypothetical protein